MESMDDETPRFNIRAVVNETGLKADTIRAWERRYGLPKPARSAGGHRQYSARDIQTIKWLRARQEEGLTISNAVDLWNSVADSGQDPLLAPEYVQPRVEKPALSGQSIDQLRAEWVRVCASFDELGAERVLDQAFAQFSVEAVCTEVLQAGMRQIGNGWYRGEITVQQEHLASEIAIRRMEALIAAAPPPMLPGNILVVAPPGEQHTFSLLLITLLLRRQGRAAIFLGANVPLPHLDSALEEVNPQLAVLSAQQLPTAARLLEAAELLNGHKVAVAFGGGIFNRLPEVRGRIPGHFLGETIAKAPPMVEALLSQRPGPRSAPKLGEEYRDALRAFEGDAVNIEARMYAVLGERGGFDGFLPTAISNTALYLHAALSLGELPAFGAEIDWIHGLLRRKSIRRQVLGVFLAEYARAVREITGVAGRPVASYLSDLAANYQPESAPTAPGIG
jgi:DNA-binding transcriptional MerR regulator